MSASSGVAPAALPDVFKSLADPTRLRILNVLRRAELAVGELAEVLGMAQSGISRHLGVLRSVGLVAERRKGASTLVRLPEAPGEGRAGTLWSLVEEWLDEMPEAAEDARRLERMMAARQSPALDYFERVAPEFDGLRAAQYGEELRARALVELLPEELTVLDVGTGTGFMLAGLPSHVGACIGVEPSEAMLEQARENLRAAGREADLRKGSMEVLPVDGASVDAVLANMVLHHAADPPSAVSEMRRVLRPGGRIVLTDLARHELEWTREELADEWPGFEPERLRSLLEGAGFERVRVESVGTCRLSRAGAVRGRGKRSEEHVVDVLLATGRLGPAAS